MKAYFGVLQDYHPKTLHKEREFRWVSFLYPLHEDLVFLIDFFPDSTFKMSMVREDLI